MYFIAHYGEIGLKGKNRPFFERALARNIAKAVSDLGRAKVKRLEGRILLEIDAPAKEVLQKLRRTFGIEYFSPVEVVMDHNYEELSELAVKLAKSRQGISSFRILAKRSYKGFPMNSMELARKLGSDVVKATGLKVNLKSPDLTVYVEVLSDRFLVYTEKIRGYGGLPVGVTGKVLHMISGGIDSPVAAWLLLRRGCELGYVHFHAYPTAEEAIEAKMGGLFRVLSSYGGDGLVFLVPYYTFHLAQVDLYPKLELVLFKRFMLKVSERLAKKHGYMAISTGESLAQVASQTLHNLVAEVDGMKMEVLRPLLSYTKQDIIELAKEIGTYDLSIKSYTDCCSIVAKHPETKAKPEQLKAAEKEIGLEKAVRAAVKEVRVFRLENGELRAEG